MIAAGLVSAGVGASTAGIAGNVLWTGVMFGLSLLFAPDVPKPEQARISFKQSVPPRIRIVGTRRTAGARMLFYGGPKGTAYIVQALCDGEAQEVSRHYLFDAVVTVDSSHYVESLGAGMYGDNKVYISTRLGEESQTAFSLAVEDLSADNVWTEDHRGRGIVASFMRCSDAGSSKQGKRFPNGLPDYSAEVTATRVFDPRDSDQVWDNPLTWKFFGNVNPILQTMWEMTAPISQGGSGLDFSECFLPVLAQMRTQADLCDEIIAKKSGTEPRYESHALYSYKTEPADFIAASLGAMDGFLAENGDGTFNLKAGVWDAEDTEVVFEDGDILQLDLKIGREDEDDVTGIIVKYNSRIHEYTTVDAPVWPRDAYQGGNDRRIRSIEVINCQSGTQAQRLAKKVALYETALITGTMVTKPYGIVAINKRGATLRTSDHPDLADCKIRLLRREVDFVNGRVEFDFQVIDPTALNAWNPATEEGALQPPVSDPVNNSAWSVPVDLIAVAYQIGNAIAVNIAFDPGSVSSDNLNYHLKWRFSDTGGGPGPWSATFTIDSDSVERPEPNVWIVTYTGAPSAVLEFQLQAFSHDESEWSVPVEVDTTVPAPGRPTAFTATVVGADIQLDCTSPNSGNFDHCRFYRATTGAGFDFATDVSGPIAGSPASPVTFTDLAPGAGSYDYWVAAENSANISSLPRGPETATI